MNIFISYRRQDTSGYALGLKREITQALDDSRVFLDVAALDGGMRWREVLEQQVAQSDLMLALIGDEWVTTRDGARSIHDEDDPVRWEIASALNQGVHLMPVLLEETRMPRQADLPSDVAGICEYQAHVVHDGTYDHNINALLERLAQLAADKTPRRVASGRRKSAAPRFPSKITESYLQTEVSGMGREELHDFLREVLRRNWTPDDAFEYGLCHSPLKPPTKLPARITLPWLASNVGLLSPKRQEKLIRELRRRGWPDQSIRQHVLDNRIPDLAPPLPSKIHEGWVARNAAFMTASDQDALADALVQRGWSQAEIRRHMPLAQIPE